VAAIVGAGDRVKVERGRPSGRQTGGAAVIDAFGARWTLDVSGLDDRAQQTADPDVPYLVSRSLGHVSVETVTVEHDLTVRAYPKPLSNDVRMRVSRRFPLPGCAATVFAMPSPLMASSSSCGTGCRSPFPVSRRPSGSRRRNRARWPTWSPLRRCSSGRTRGQQILLDTVRMLIADELLHVV